MPSFFAFLHHLAAFGIFSTLVLELVLLKDELTIARARKLLGIDLVYGILAGLILVVGLLRVFYFEKGSAYYFHNHAFITKMSLFLLVGLLSVYPTVEFLSWRKTLKLNQLPVISEQKLRRIRSLIHWELVGLVLIILCATLMARGIGYKP